MALKHSSAGISPGSPDEAPNKEGVLLIASASNIPRVHVMARSLTERGVKATVLEWDRGGRLQSSLIDSGTIVRRFRLRSSPGWKAAFRYPVWSMFSVVFILKGRFRVIQAENLDNLILPLLLRGLTRSKVVYDLADFYADGYLPDFKRLGKIVAWFERLLIRNVDGLITVSEYQKFQTNHLPPNHAVIYNVPPEHELAGYDSPSKSIDAPSRRITLYYGGSFSRDRVTSLLNLAAALQDFEDIRLRITGWGEFESVIETEAKRTKNVEYLGYTSYSDALRETAMSDCIILAYESSHPNMRLTIACKFMEALALSKPLLAPDHTYMGKLVNDIGCGFVTDFTDVDALKRTLAMVIQSSTHLNEMGRKGRRAYEEHYRWPLLEEKYMDLYRRSGISVSNEFKKVEPSSAFVQAAGAR